MLNFCYPTSFMSSSGYATNMSYANFPYWSLLPMLATNIAGDYQLTPVEPFGGYKLGLLFNPIAAQTWGIPSMFADQLNSNVPTGSIESAAAQQAQEILTPIYNNMASSEINKASQLIQCAKTRMEATINNEKATQEEKDAAQRVLDTLKEQEAKLEELKKSTDLDPETAFKQAREINTEIAETLKEAKAALSGTETATPTTSETNNKADKTDKSKETNTSKKSDKSGKSEKSEMSDKTKKTVQANAAVNAKNKDDEPQGISTENIEEYENAYQGVTDIAHKAIYRPGTGDELYTQVLDGIDKDNVVPFMTSWNKFHSKQKGESFMKAFMWDAESGFLCFGQGSGKKATYGRTIATALREKAVELGVYDQCSKDFAAIDEEMGSWFYINNDIYKNYDNIIKVLADKMGSKHSSPYKKMSA